MVEILVLILFLVLLAVVVTQMPMDLWMKRLVIGVAVIVFLMWLVTNYIQ